MNKLYIVLISVFCLIACGNQAKIDTDIVKVNTLYLEQITDTTNISTFLKGVQPHDTWSGQEITDNRLLKYAGIPVKSFSYKENEDDGKVNTITIILFEDSAIKDGETISKYLTNKFGEDESEERRGTKQWMNEDKTIRYSLKITEEGYSNDSELIISFGGTYNYY